MKKTYQSPEALVIKIQINESLLINMSDTTVEDGGWVKEEAGTDDPTITDKSLWDDEW